MEPGTQMGPLVSDEQFRRVTGYLDSGSPKVLPRWPAAAGSATGLFVEPR